MTSKYRHDGLRDLGLGDAVMVSKERSLGARGDVLTWYIASIL